MLNDRAVHGILVGWWCDTACGGLRDEGFENCILGAKYVSL